MQNYDVNIYTDAYFYVDNTKLGSISELSETPRVKNISIFIIYLN